MHEMSLITNVLGTALRVAAEHGGAPIEAIHLEIGALRQVQPAALEFAFEAARSGTKAEHALLKWTQVPARIKCAHCGQCYEPPNELWMCPVCKSFGGEALQGNELVLTSVTLKDEAAGVSGVSERSDDKQDIQKMTNPAPAEGENDGKNCCSPPYPGE